MMLPSLTGSFTQGGLCGGDTGTGGAGGRGKLGGGGTDVSSVLVTGAVSTVTPSTDEAFAALPREELAVEVTESASAASATVTEKSRLTLPPVTLRLTWTESTPSVVAMLCTRLVCMASS